MHAAQSVETTSRPVGRLAPSPTGRLHLGHARTFLLAWWHARSRGGRVVLRIEDLDVARAKPGAIESQVEDLRWLGLDWDGDPILQSADTIAMARACDVLVERGLAYACVCTRAEIAALSAPHADDAEARYPGTCDGRFASPAQARETTGREPALRLRVPRGAIAIEDRLQGKHAFDVHAQVGDFVLRRRDGAFAYQLAVCVDDARQGVTEVVRAEDLLASAARQSLIQDLLGLPHPAWWHVPWVADEQGARLAKRRDSLTLAALREAKVDPRRIVAWAARTAAQSAPPLPTAADVLPHFDLTRLPPTRPTVDAALLAALAPPAT